ncbi:unnamed protein product [Paramecium pentaurelia]|uniref:Uncharacterized protein n=1 Tax=Paramecium pentaurelia TaxID=43138 RepID=A0A8S1VT07_9CILI|nr:unnamed protein product [Paramecium pentaurelia]
MQPFKKLIQQSLLWTCIFWNHFETILYSQKGQVLQEQQITYQSHDRHSLWNQAIRGQNRIAASSPSKQILNVNLLYPLQTNHSLFRNSIPECISLLSQDDMKIIQSFNPSFGIQKVRKNFLEIQNLGQFLQEIDQYKKRIIEAEQNI